MGSNNNNICHVIPLMSELLLLLLLLSSLNVAQGSSSHTLDRDSLDSFIHEYAIKNMSKRYTGKLYDIPLPTNFSGMESSIVRFRSSSFWRGANFSFFKIPNRVLPWPFVKRFDIIYENLGNLSSKYYDVTNYTFVTPVIGFLAYDARRSRENYGMVELNTMENHILIHFPHDNNMKNVNVTMKCVRFVTNGTIEFSNVTMNYTCKSRGQGHFAIVVPLKPEEEVKKGKWKWWVIGFGVGIIGLILLIVIGTLIYKCVRLKKRCNMERQSEKSEALDAVWVGNSRMPSASGIRTQPVLENSYVP